MYLAFSYQKESYRTLDFNLRKSKNIRNGNKIMTKLFLFFCGVTGSKRHAFILHSLKFHVFQNLAKRVKTDSGKRSFYMPAVACNIILMTFSLLKTRELTKSLEAHHHYSKRLMRINRLLVTSVTVRGYR